MKKNIGSVIGLYPMPLVVIGSTVNGKTNWVLVGHLGIIGHDRIMVSLAKAHYTNEGIRETGILSVNIVDTPLLKKADHVGCVSGAKIDKSETFEYTLSEKGAPMINDSPLSMECSVIDVYETKDFESFILKVENTYVEEQCLNEKNKIDYSILKPILFEMPTYEYLQTGDIAGKCMSMNK